MGTTGRGERGECCRGMLRLCTLAVVAVGFGPEVCRLKVCREGIRSARDMGKLDRREMEGGALTFPGVKGKSWDRE